MITHTMNSTGYILRNYHSGCGCQLQKVKVYNGNRTLDGVLAMYEEMAPGS